MSKKEKLIARMVTCPKDFTYDETVVLLTQLGFTEYQNGKTSGSRVRFYHSQKEVVINLHKPHPKNIMKSYQLKQLIASLKEEGFIDE